MAKIFIGKVALVARSFCVAGDHCSIGGPGTGTTIPRCGDGLTCKENADGYNYCERMNTTCHSAQDSFDTRRQDGQTGSLEMRPACDAKGDYETFSCVPTQSCFCQSKEGERIFGEVRYTGSSLQQNMQCGCSRTHQQIQKLIQPGVPYHVVGPRCTSDGNYYPIQCLDRICYCVDPITGVTLSGEKRMVDLDIQPITRLDCYDKELDLFPHQSEGKPPFNFTTPCIMAMEERIELLMQSVEDGFNVDFASSIPGCEPDGTFGRISTSRNRTKICVDEMGARIGDYEAFPGTTEYNNMDCKCAYTSHIIMASEIEHPVCCSNGNFRRIQCRRGLCRCVDADGRQTEKENADPMMLSCFTFDWRTC